MWFLCEGDYDGSAGEVTNTYAYDAFGNLVSAFGSTANDYLYSGERLIQTSAPTTCANATTIQNADGF